MRFRPAAGAPRDRALCLPRRAVLAAILALWLGSAAGSPAAPGGPAPDAVRLAPGPAVEAGISAGAPQRYRLAAGPLPAAGSWRIFVEEEGADVVLELFAPDGSLLATADSPNSRFGLESVLFHPEAAGEYEVRIRVSSLVQVAGRYAVGVETVPAAKPETTLAAARRREAEASRHFAAGTREGREAALAEYRQALPLWRALGRPREEWDTLYSMAVLARIAGDSRQALALLAQALAVRQAPADPRQEARTLNEMGFARFSLGEVEAAQELYRRALALWERAPDPYGEALTRNNLGLTYHSRGDLRAATGHYEQALALLRTAEDPRGEAILANNLGGVLLEMGEPAEALSRFEEALARQRELGDRHEAANLLGNLARAHQETGRYDEALDLYRQALALAHGEGDARNEGRLLSSLGLLDRFLGEPARAAEHLAASLELRRRTGDRAGEAITLHNLGLTRLDLGDAAQASELFRQALEIQRALGDRRGEAIDLYTLGTLEAGNGQTARGVEHIDRSLELLRALGDRRETCEALRRSGEALAAAMRPAEARQRLVESLASCPAVAGPLWEMRTRLALARVERRLGRPDAALELAGEALAEIESTRAALASPDLRASFLSRQLGAYDLAIDLEMEEHRRDPRAGHDRAALALSERARARSLLDLLEESGADVRLGMDPALGERRRLLEQRLEAKARRRLTLGGSPRDAVRRQTLDAELRSLVEDLESADAEIRRRNPRYADLVRPQPLDATAIQGLLDPETLMLVYSLGEERSFLWAVSSSSVDSFELPPRRVIEAAARAVYDAWRVLDVRARGEDDAAAAKLSALVLAPAARLLGGRRLVVVADGALQYIPFAALPLPAADDARPARAEPLLVRHEVVSLPSASTLAVQRQLLAGRAEAPRMPQTVAVLADPVFQADDPRLRRSGSAASAPAAGAGLASRGFVRLAWSRAEAEAIARLAGGGRSFVATDFDANLETLTGGRLRGYDVIHLATHGVLDAGHPALSGLVLSLVDRDGRERPGFLSLSGIYNLDLGADLVVLSGCETALGREVKGEGLVGLARGFLHAGAARVAASLWRVQDRATAELMGYFYAALLRDGERPPAALRQAQLSMLRDSRWSDPYHWAAFVLYGDWR